MFLSLEPSEDTGVYGYCHGPNIINKSLINLLITHSLKHYLLIIKILVFIVVQFSFFSLYSRMYTQDYKESRDYSTLTELVHVVSD